MGNGVTLQPTYAPQNNHSETLHRNVADNQFTATALQTNATKLTYCPLHPGIPTCRIEKDGTLFERVTAYPIACTACLAVAKPTPTASSNPGIRTSDGSVVTAGTYIFACGGRYEGQLKNGLPFGKGIHYCRGGYVLNGYWDGERANGYGVKTFENGNVYKGNFVDNRYSGQGSFFTKSSSTVYVGEFREGKCWGWGTLTYQNTNLIVEGNFVDGSMDGEMQAIQNGIPVKYIFKNGQLVSASTFGRTMTAAELQSLRSMLPIL